MKDGNAILLVHDVVNDFMDAADAALPGVLANIAALLASARTAAVPVVFAAPGQGDRDIGPFPEEKPGDPLIWGLCRPIPDQGWGAVTAAEVAKVTFSILAQRFARIATTSDICAELSSRQVS